MCVLWSSWNQTFRRSTSNMFLRYHQMWRILASFTVALEKGSTPSRKTRGRNSQNLARIRRITRHQSGPSTVFNVCSKSAGKPRSSLSVVQTSEGPEPNPTPRIALFVRPSVKKYRIVYSQCIYDADIITNVRCGQDDDDHHHLCTMRSSSWWLSSSFVYDAIIITMTIIIICVRCDHHHDGDNHHLCTMRS